MNPFVERDQEQISGVLSCFDRVVIIGTLPDIGHAGATAQWLGAQDIRLFDYIQWTEPLREELLRNAERLAAEAGLEIKLIRHHGDFRKEARVQEILAQRGEHPGLVHVFSAMEACPSYRPRFVNPSHTASLKSTPGKCLHYHFYFFDPQFGLWSMRVRTLAPFRLQVHFNGHSWLARQLTAAGIAFERADVAIVSIADPQAAQLLADGLEARTLHEHLDQ